VPRGVGPFCYFTPGAKKKTEKTSQRKKGEGKGGAPKWVQKPQGVFGSWSQPQNGGGRGGGLSPTRNRKIKLKKKKDPKPQKRPGNQINGELKNIPKNINFGR